MFIKLKTYDEKVFSISVDEMSNLADFRVKVQESTEIPIQEQKLISMGKFLKSDVDFEKLKTQESPNVQVNDSRQNSARLAIKGGKRANRGSGGASERSLVLQKYEMCWTLLANCESCLDAFANGISPQNRVKFSAPRNDMVLSNPDGPMGPDMGVLMERVAALLANYATVTKECSVLVKDVGETEAEKKRSQEKVQLMMDTARYLAVLNQTISCMIIPLRRNPGERQLSYRANPVARRSNNQT